MLGAIVPPGAEHGVTRHRELFVRILRKVALGVLLDYFLVLSDYFLQRLGIEFGVELYFALLLLAIEHFVEFELLNVEHYVAEHLNQAAIGVVSEARIIAQLGQRFDALVIQA